MIGKYNPLSHHTGSVLSEAPDRFQANTGGKYGIKLTLSERSENSHMSVNLCPSPPQQYFTHFVFNLKAKRQKGQSTTDHIKDDLLTLATSDDWIIRQTLLYASKPTCKQ